MIRLLSAALLSIGLVSSVACTEQESAPEGTPPPITTVDVQSDQEAQAVAAARRFLSAFESRDGAALSAMLSHDWSEGSGREWVAEFGGTTAVTLVSLRVERDRPRPAQGVLVVVTLDVSPSSHGSNWNPGANDRVLQLVEENGAWKVAGIGG